MSYELRVAGCVSNDRRASLNRSLATRNPQLATRNLLRGPTAVDQNIRPRDEACGLGA